MNLYFVTFAAIVSLDRENSSIVSAETPEEALELTNKCWFNRLDRSTMTVKLIGTAIEGTPSRLLCWADPRFNDFRVVP